MMNHLRGRMWMLVGGCFAAAFLGVLPSAQAHDGSWSGDIGGVGPDYAVWPVHEDDAPFKGFFTATIRNTGLVAWDHLHIRFFDPFGTQNIANLSFLDSTTVPPGPDPTSSQNPLSWVIDNVIVPARIDLYFPAAPVMPGATGWFTVYTDNPDQLPFFGLMVYPTPEPATLLPLALAGLLLRRR